MALLRSFRPQGNSKRNIEKILLIQFGGIGDMVMITPAIRALLESHPHADISILGFSEYNCRFLLKYSNVSKISNFNIYSLDMRQILKPRSWKSLLDTISYLRHDHYDLLFSFRYLKLIDWLFIEWLLIYFCKARLCIGINPPFLKRFSIYDRWMMETAISGKHYKDFFCDLVEMAGILVSTRTTDFPLTETDMKSADNMLSPLPVDASIVCIHIGGARLKLENETWDIANYLAIVEKLIEKGIFIVLPGAEEDSYHTQKIALHVSHNCIDLAGKTSIEEMAAIIKKSHLFIGNDSGPFHIAVAVGTPAIGIFTRTLDEPEYYLYKNDNVFVFRDSFTQIPSVDAVLKKAESFLSQYN
jgi:ADP-heptose:LPS heptosyltransferase